MKGQGEEKHFHPERFRDTAIKAHSQLFFTLALLLFL